MSDADISPKPAQGACETTDADVIGVATGCRFPIVAIGASAGGLEAFESFFKKMPSDSGMAFILIQHLDPTHRSMLPELVAKFTAMQVYEITDGIEIIPNCVYVIPPDRDLGILHGALHLLEPPERRGLRHPIDAFFRSLALEQGDRAICIVLSGTGTEGTLGLRDIKAAGGFVIVQKPESAKFGGMPISAIGTGLADLILPVEEIPENLTELISGGKTVVVEQQPETGIENPDFLKKILMLIRSKTGHDFYHYKKNTIVRRIDRRMAVHKIQRVQDYLRYLQHYPLEIETLFRELLIGVTNFFRDTEAFSALRDTVIPAICDGRTPNDEIRVWVTACSTGEEALSIALLIHERLSQTGQSVKVQVFATDIDSRAISIARRGFYPASIAVDIPPDLLQRYFVVDEGGYRIGKLVRDTIIYAEQNIIKDPPFSKLDMISCRNVLIYMGGELQKKIIPLFHYALKSGGFLFLGTSETIGDVSDLFSVVDRKMKIFKSKGGAALPLPNLTIGSASAARITPTEERPMDSAPQQINFPTIMEKLMLAEFTPPSLLVNRQYEVVCVHGRTGKFLELAPGTDSRNLMAMAREGLKVYLSSALRSAFEQDASAPPAGDIVCRRVRVKTNGDYQTINLRVRLLTTPPSVQGLALVLFEEFLVEPTERVDGDASLPDEGVLKIRELEHELQASRDYLRTTVEELETSNEELKSSNEELQSTNEELQSINEEHETSKEELQSVNEEVTTVNCELERKMNELSTANNDINNLFASTEIATLFLDDKLLIKRFTPEVVRVFNLLRSDVGRQLGDFTGNLNYPDIVVDAKSVLDSLIPKVKEARTKEGSWYKVRIITYRTTDNVIDGVVITFIDITDLKALEVKSRLTTVVRDSNDAVTVVGFDGRFLAWNRGAEQIYGIGESEAVGLSVFDIFADRHQDGLQRLIARIAKGETIERFVTERELRTGRMVRLQVTATALRDDDGRPQAVAATERVITELEQINYDASQVLKAMPMPVIVEGVDGNIIFLNAVAETLFRGDSGLNLLGQPASSLVPCDDVQESIELLNRCRQGETIRCIRSRRVGGDGKVRAVIITLLHLAERDLIATLVEEDGLPGAE